MVGKDPVTETVEPLRGGIVRYSETEVLIKLSAVEIQPALAIELDRGLSQALQFIEGKIVVKCFQALYKLSSVSIKATATCKMRRCSSSYCLSGYRSVR